eukprot:g9536.t1
MSDSDRKTTRRGRNSTSPTEDIIQKATGFGTKSPPHVKDAKSGNEVINPLFKQQLKGNDRRETTDIDFSSFTGRRRKRSSLLILGNEVEVDENLKWRVQLGQRLAGIFGVISILFFVIGDTIFKHQNSLVLIGLCLNFIICLFGLCMIFYKNISLPIIRRLLKEINVVVILVLVVCDFFINIFKPHNWFSPINGLLYFLMILCFVLMDAIMRKSRTFMLIASSIVALSTTYNIYANTLGPANVGVILLKYQFAGNNLEFQKRSIKRSIYTQLFCFCLQGIVATFKDKKKELMIFAKGNIYRDTGTSSRTVEDREYVEDVANDTNSSIQPSKIIQNQHLVRKTQRIVVGMMFFNEFQLLKLNLLQIYQHVSKIIISEANVTHSGMPKPFYLYNCLIKNISNANCSRQMFQPFLKKLRLVKVGNLPLAKNELELNNATMAWIREKRQRDSILKGCKNEPENTMLITGDCDEILNANAIPRLRKIIEDADTVVVYPLYFHLDFYYYSFANYVDNEKWLHPELHGISRKHTKQDQIICASRV